MTPLPRRPLCEMDSGEPSIVADDAAQLVPLRGDPQERAAAGALGRLIEELRPIDRPADVAPSGEGEDGRADEELEREWRDCRCRCYWILWRTFKGVQELNALVRSPKVVAEDQSKQSPGSPHAFSGHAT